ncbi:MAG: sugar phosphate nucleotidyltransferase [Candidatus Buchananbacteria bacterium]
MLQNVPRVTAVVLGGGRGERLMPLTRNRPKPNTPIEKRRLFDFVGSNCVNSPCVSDVHLLAQYYANKLIRHAQETYLGRGIRKPVWCQVAPMISGREFFAGTADAVRQSQYLFDSPNQHMLVLSGDHLYTMDYGPLVSAHVEQDAAITVAVAKMPTKTAANRFGVFRVNESGLANGFEEKPENPIPIPGTEECFASLGIYVFNVAKLQELLKSCPGMDFGQDIIPYALRHNGYPLALWEYNGYWRDIGTIRSLFEANMDLLGPTPPINLYNQNWPIYHRALNLASPKFINGCVIEDSIVSDGSIIAGEIRQAVISTRVRIGSNSHVHKAVIMDMTQIGEDVSLTNVIVDKKCQIGNGVVLGQNPEEEIKRYSEIELVDGIIVVPRDTVLAA